MKKRKQPWLHTYKRNYQAYDSNERQNNTWCTYTTYADSHRPYQIQPGFQNHYYGVPYINEYNRSENDDCTEIINLSNDDSDADSKPTTHQEKTVIKKDGLYKDAASFHSDNGSSRDNASSSTSNGNGANTGTWTEAFWQKHDDTKSQSSGSLFTAGQSLGKPKKRSENKLEKSINEMLAKPVEMNKGKSLLEKMGWQGGGLGKDGGGIVEPIAPKATYAVKTIGLGHPNETTKVKKKITKPANKNINKVQVKGNFCTNVLLNILEFVRNDRTIEMFFDNKLFDGERKRIHQIVEKIRELDNLDDFVGFKDKDLDIVKDIWVHNMYELWTQSEGERRRNRQLCLYKEAPEHVYLVTPDDLRDDTKDIDNDKKIKEDNTFITNSNEKKEKTNEHNSNEVNEKSNDKRKETVTTDHDVGVKDKDIEKELNSKKMNNIKCSNNEYALNKKEHNEEIKVTESMLGKIVDYFKEFANDAIYTEFRCLGPFNEAEVDNLTLFFDICMKKDDNESQEKDEVLKVLCNAEIVFNVQEDINGSMLICKSERNQLPIQ